MKLKDFKKLFRGLPPDTEVMLVADWTIADENGDPLLCDANCVGYTSDEPQGINKDGVLYVYIYNDPDYEDE